MYSLTYAVCTNMPCMPSDTFSSLVFHHVVVIEYSKLECVGAKPRLRTGQGLDYELD